MLLDVEQLVRAAQHVVERLVAVRERGHLGVERRFALSAILEILLALRVALG